MKTNIKGVGVALITPFKDSGEIDFEALERLLNRVISGGADYLVVLGTTAETPTLSAEERIAVTKFVIEKIMANCPLYWVLEAIVPLTLFGVFRQRIWKGLMQSFR